MAQVILFYKGEMVRQRGMTAPKKATLERWLSYLRKVFSQDFVTLGVSAPLNIWKSSVTPEEIRISCHGDIAFYVVRGADPLSGGKIKLT